MTDAAEVRVALERARTMAGAYAGDPEFEQIVRGMEQKLEG